MTMSIVISTFSHQLSASAVQVQPVLLPKDTDPIIQCIIDGNLKKMKKLIKRNREVNGLYPCAIWGDNITPLMAAVRSGKEDACTFLLKNGADPNKLSEYGWRPLHYVSHSTLDILRKLLEAKAYPDIIPGEGITPLQYAVQLDRADIVKELIMAGAFPDSNYGKNPEVDEKLVTMITHFASESKDFYIMKIFFDFVNLHVRKSPEEVFEQFKKELFKEHPITHMRLVDFFFKLQIEEYQQIGIKFLKECQKLDSYTKETIKRFSRIPSRAQWNAVICLNVVFCIVKEISVEDSLEIIPKLLKYLSSEILKTKKPVSDELRLDIVKLLYIITQKTLGKRHGWDNTLVMSLYEGVLPFTDPLRCSSLKILAYAVFANLFAFECIPAAMASSGVTSVPEIVLSRAETGIAEDLKEKLRWLNTALQSQPGPALQPSSSVSQESESCSLSVKKKRKKKKKPKQPQLPTQEESSGCPTTSKDKCISNLDYEHELGKSIQESGSVNEDLSKEISTCSSESSEVQRRWFEISVRWKSQLQRFVSLSANEVYKVGSMNLVVNENFRIAKGSDGTEVYLGLRDDGTEVAIKRMLKSNYQILKNECELLRLPKLDSPHIVRYIDFAEDENFGYLVLQLCEYTLDEYIKEQLPKDDSSLLKRIVYDVLHSLSVLHGDDMKILHRDIKPQNVLIDVNGNARLADFGISRRLHCGQTTLHTASVGTRCWMAQETLDDDDDGNKYKRSSDIQVAGMLIYYILSRGHHPFGKGALCEANIYHGKYCLDQVEDEVAKDLIEWMIQKDRHKRPKIDETLAHPYFWESERRVEYLKKIGNQNEVQNYNDASEELLRDIDEYTQGKSFNQWKSKLHSELIQKLEGKKKRYPENTLGLLRFIRNLHEHYPADAEALDLMATFPDLFSSVYKFAKKMDWHSRPNLQKIFKK